ncbi:MAG: T9SS type A sorting domain-containing protein [Bacteroidales bacterium]|jgi:hypothetical protein|nr:T9SS type A sorting domain-containing protein [Bacteroidales bacterium]
MKKLYTTLIALLVASTVFAQIQMQEKDPSGARVFKIGDNSRVPFQRPQTNNSKASATYTFNFIETAWQYIGEPQPGDQTLYSTAVADANCAAYNSDGIVQSVTFGSIGQVFDFKGIYFNYWEFCMAGQTFNMPNLSTANSFSIDSIGIAMYYDQGSEVSDDFVDTLVISYVVGLEHGYYSYFGNDPEAPSMRGYFPSVLGAPTYGFDPNSDYLSDSAEVITQKILLTKTHADYENVIFTFPAPAELNNVRYKTIGVLYGFIPGTIEGERDTLTSVMEENVNFFGALISKNPISEYWATVSGGGSARLAADMNTPLFSSYDTYFDASTSNQWYLQMFPSRILNTPANTYYYPEISLTTTCNDCDIFSVKDIEKKSITVRPNPATNMFTVDLEENGSAQVQLFNLVGQLVYSEQTNDSSISVNVSNLNSGVYMLKIMQDGKIHTSKVIVR